MCLVYFLRGTKTVPCIPHLREIYIPLYFYTRFGLPFFNIGQIIYFLHSTRISSLCYTKYISLNISLARPSLSSFKNSPHILSFPTPLLCLSDSITISISTLLGSISPFSTLWFAGLFSSSSSPLLTLSSLFDI